MAAFDPGAQLNTTLADIALQKGNEEAALGESAANLQANVGYQENQVTQAEPGTYRSNANTANRGGILTSGINARRKDTIASNFASRRTANQLALTQGEARIQRERESGSLNREREVHGALDRRAQEEDRLAAENPPVAPGTPSAPSAGTAPGTSGLPTVVGRQKQPVSKGATANKRYFDHMRVWGR